MNSAFTIVLVLAFASLVICTNVNKCKRGDLPLSVSVENCDQSPCNFVKGKDAVVNVTFEVPEDIEKLTPEVIALALGVEVNYPLSQRDACKSLLDGECPLEEGERVTYQLRMPILQLYPQVDLGLTLTLYSGDEKTPVTCFQVDGKVVSA